MAENEGDNFNDPPLPNLPVLSQEEVLLLFSVKKVVLLISPLNWPLIMLLELIRLFNL